MDAVPNAPQNREVSGYVRKSILLGSKQIADRTRKKLERIMNPMVKTLLRRFLLTLSGIVVWAKALAGGRGDEQTRSMPETDQKTVGGRQQKPNRKPQ